MTDALTEFTPPAPPADEAPAPVPVPPLPGEVDERPGILAFRSSLTGFDDIAVQKYFGQVQELGPNMHTRTLGFVLLRRNGDDDANAHMKIMAMPIGDVEGMFRDDTDEGNG